MKWSAHQAMVRAIEEGRRGAGFVSPNPLVGCVILDSHFEFLSAGYHARLGDLHAEAAAVAAVPGTDQARLKGAHVFVTLEPCAHQGRQPSCAKMLAALPIASVTYGLMDPNPRVAGQGARILTDAGKTVEVYPELQERTGRLAEIFLLNMRTGRPFVALKVATSLDGQVALEDGRSQWITGESARERVQFLRGSYDAVLTGAGTFLKDNPRLNSRDPLFAGKKQRVVMLDPDGFTLNKLAGSALLTARAPEDVWLVTKPGLKVSAGVRHLELKTSVNGDFALDELLRDLHQAGMHSLFVEAGAHTASSFLKQRLVDRLFVFMAPKLLGKGLGWTSGMSVPSLEQAIGLTQMQAERLGDDLLLSGRPRFAGI